MTVATLLNPEVGNANFFSEPFRPEEVRASLEHRDDVLIINNWTHELLLPPDAAAIGIFRSHVTLFEKIDPCRRRIRPCT